MSQPAEAPTARAISIRVPWVGRGAFLLLAGIALFILGFGAMIRRPVDDQFASYDDLFNGAVYEAALARGFTCQDTSVKEQAAPILSRCRKQDAGGMFPDITLWIADGVTREIRFSVRDKAMRLGDFILLWGNPTSMLHCEMLVVFWPTHYLLGDDETPHHGRINVMLPVRSVAFTADETHRYDGMRLNEMRHDCRNF
ncbi:MAG: hypothetical protein IT320_18865 [Anaerolineae bacterium]|nr:hypothetical protein [Anaerolineae bacterium]